MRRQVFPVLVTSVLNARRGLGPTVNQTPDGRLIKRAGVGLRERLAGRQSAQIVKRDRLARPCVNRALRLSVDARRAFQSFANTDGVESGDVNVDEVRIRTADAANRASAARRGRVLVIKYDVRLIRGFEALKPRQPAPLCKAIDHA